MCTGASSLVAFAFFILVFCLASACSAATCLAAILAAILVVTAAASAAGSFVVFIKSFGTNSVPNLLGWAKTWWSCDRGGGGGGARSCPTARCGLKVGARGEEGAKRVVVKG